MLRYTINHLMSISNLWHVALEFRLKNENMELNTLIVRHPQNSTVYLKYLIESLVRDGYIDDVCNIATFAHFTKDKVCRVPYPTMSVEEQHKIAEYLDKKCSKIDSSISKYIKQKELLERYRKALIAQVVTGKRRVCEPIFDYPNTTQMPPAMAAEENI